MLGHCDQTTIGHYFDLWIRNSLSDDSMNKVYQKITFVCNIVQCMKENSRRYMLVSTVPTGIRVSVRCFKGLSKLSAEGTKFSLVYPNYGQLPCTSLLILLSNFGNARVLVAGQRW